MSQSSHTFSQDTAKKLQHAIVSNADMISGLLGNWYQRIDGYQSSVDEELDRLSAKITFSKDIITIPGTLHDIHIDIKKLYEAVRYFDVNDAYSYLDVLHEVLAIFKEVMPKIVSMADADKNRLFYTMDTLEHLAEDIAELIDFGIGDDAHTLEAWATSIHKTMIHLIDQLEALGLSGETSQTIKAAISPILQIIIMAAAHHEPSEQQAYLDQLRAELSKEATYKRIFEPDTERVIHNIDQHFDDIFAEVKKLPLTEALPDTKTEPEAIWKESITRFRSLDPEGYDDIVYAFENIKENVDATFDFITGKYPQGKDIIDNTIRPHVDAWLTLPYDFRPNNWVEIVHIIIKNIQHSLRTSLNNVGPVQDMILPVVDKLEAILSTVDNDAFKLLITPKEAPVMHRITLPDLLPSEPKEKIKEDDPDQAEQLGVKELPHADVHHHTDRVLNDAAESGDTPPEKLTWSMVIDYLCFDKEHGAIKHMDPNLRDVIHDLYYRDWLSYRLEHLEEEVMSIFTLEKYQPIWEDIKAKLLDEKGVNLGEFLTYLIEKVVATINELITFVRDTIQYIIDEIFNLVKAIIQFFEKVDLPGDARKFIKTIPLFKDMPDNVTILHVIAAIPYTLYTEFIRFEVPQPAAV